MMLHDSHKAYFRTPNGPVPTGTKVTIRFQCDEATSVILRTWQDEELCYSMVKTAHNDWQITITMPVKPGLFWYSFIVYRKDGRTMRYGNAYDKLGGVGAIYEKGEAESFQITVYDKDFTTPAYFHGANIYQIFPDRFWRGKTASVDTRTDRYIHKSWDEEMISVGDMRGGKHQELDFYGGNLMGIVEKLPYLRHRRGVPHPVQRGGKAGHAGDAGRRFLPHGRGQHLFQPFRQLPQPGRLPG